MIRAGLGEAAQARRDPAPRTKHGIDLDRLNQLADDLEVEAFAESLRPTPLA